MEAHISDGIGAVGMAMFHLAVGKSHPSNETLEVLVVGLFPGCWFVGLLVVLCHCVSSSNRRAESNVTIILQPVISSDRH